MAEIVLLEECPDFAPILAFWTYMEWYTTRSIPFDIVLKAYKQRTNGIAPVWIAVDNKLPVGMVSLKTDDLWSRKDLNPWLSSLFVLPEFRNKGIGSQLINTVTRKCAELKNECVYLFIDVENKKNSLYYKKRGWKFLEQAAGNDDKPVNIFYFVNN